MQDLAGEYYRATYMVLNGTKNPQYIQTVYCKEFYAEQIDNKDQFFLDHFNNSYMLCPNTTEFILGGSAEMVM